MLKINRRVFIESLGLSALSCWQVASALAQQSESSTQQPGGDSTDLEIVESWMSAWIEEQSREPVGNLHLSRFVEPVYYLTKPITWRPNPGQQQFSEVVVPVGFVTDLASIPRPFFSLLRPDGEYTYPAIVHDFLYWTQERSRKAADTIFKLGMDDFGIDNGTIEIIYQAVRRGGRVSWRRNAKLKQEGERRVLARFPTDPRTRWEEWKKAPENFK